jgi:type VI secretion system protein VasD
MRHDLLHKNLLTLFKTMALNKPNAIRSLCLDGCRVWLCAGLVFLSGCGSAPTLSEGLGNMGNKTLEVIGYKKPEVPAMPATPTMPAMPTMPNMPAMPNMPGMPTAPQMGRTPEPQAIDPKTERSIKLRIAASDSLNVDPQGNSLSLVIRIYKLREPTAFLNAPHDVFGNPTREKEVLADSLIDVREVVLQASGQYQLHDRWARQASHLGVVALYRIPNSVSWRYALELDTMPIEEGLVLGAHACALSLGSGQSVRPNKVSLSAHTPDCPTRKIPPQAQPQAQPQYQPSRPY